MMIYVKKTKIYNTPSLHSLPFCIVKCLEMCWCCFLQLTVMWVTVMSFTAHMPNAAQVEDSDILFFSPSFSVAPKLGIIPTEIKRNLSWLKMATVPGVQISSNRPLCLNHRVGWRLTEMWGVESLSHYLQVSE